MPFSTDSALRVGRPPSRIRRYLFALGVVALATAGRLALDPVVGPRIPHLPYVASTVIVSWFCGVETAVASAVISALVGNYLFSAPRYEWIPDAPDLVAMLVFGLVVSGLAVLVAGWRRTEVALRQRAEELQILLDTVPAAVFVTRDPDARHMEGNRFAAQYVRLPAGANLSLTAPGSERPSYRIVKGERELSGDELPVQQVLARGAESHDNEFELVSDDGTRRTLFGNASPLRDEKGRVRGSIGVFIDVTERRRMEKRLREQAEELSRADRVKDEFLATLGHELRTPLNAIVGWSSLLLKGGLPDDMVRRAHEAIASNAESQRALIEDVLDVSRIISGRLRLEARETDIVATAAAAIDAVRPVADESGITIETAFGTGPALVLGDPARLQQVFVNLLANAVKFTGRGGVIRVTTARVDYEIQVRVQDDGIGIPADMLPQVFERFRQADSSATRTQTGLGLGLAIVRHLVELHGGWVTAESAGAGQGATFTVRLPSRTIQERRHEQPAAPRQVAPLAETAASTPSLCGVRVLVVDDQPDARMLVSSVLRRSGASVEVAGCGTEALQCVDRVGPDVLLIDIAMPGMDGYSLLRHLRDGGGRAAQAPAIAFTAYAREEDRRRATASGFQLHLAKPVQPDALVKAVRSVWEQRPGASRLLPAPAISEAPPRPR